MILKGENIVVRDWEIHDFPLYRKWNNGKHLWKEFDGPYYPKASSMFIESKIKSLRQRIEKKSWANLRSYLVIADKTNNELIGTVVWYWESKESNWKSIGLIIYNEKIWGKGIGFEALKLWINYLFENDITLKRLDLRTWSGHQGMMNLALKLGFKEEARFRNAREVKGKVYDSIAMGILREEWKEER